MSVTQTPFAPLLNECASLPEPVNTSQFNTTWPSATCAPLSQYWSWHIMQPLPIIRLLRRR